MEQEKKTESNVGLTKKQIASRILKRKDNIYSLDTVKNIIQMYLEECSIALENGEKINLSGLGTLTPKVHTPRTYNISSCNIADGENPPYTSIFFIKNRKLKEKMDHHYIKNIERGFLGLSEKCKCNAMQRTILIEKGYIKDGE